MLSNWSRAVIQAARVRRSLPRLPEAVGRVGHRGSDAATRHIVALGDSVAAGVGLARGEETVAGRLAGLLAGPVGAASWAIHARGGLDARGVLGLLDDPRVADDLAAADVVVVSVGVNDLKGGRSMARWRDDLRALLDRAVTATAADVVLLGMPPVATFPALSSPLRDLLGVRARRMDVVAVEVARRCGVLHLPLESGLLRTGDAFSADGFHPSAGAHARLAEAVAALLATRSRGEADVVR